MLATFLVPNGSYALGVGTRKKLTFFKSKVWWVERSALPTLQILKAELIENLGWGYDLYAVVVIADGSFLSLKGLNEFAPVNQAQTWLQPRIQGQATTIIDLTLPEGLSVGRYCIYGILSPQKEDVFETLEKGLWVMNQRCFDISDPTVHTRWALEPEKNLPFSKVRFGGLSFPLYPPYKYYKY